MLRIASLPGLAAAAAVLVSIFPATPASAAGSPLGVWIDDKGRGAVEITECGGALCGKVVWVKSKSDAKGCGAKILGEVRPVGGGSWDNGWIYSPEHGRKFDVALAPIGNDRLRVTGYAGIKLFAENHTWTRAPADLPRCDNPETVAAAKTSPAPAVRAKAPATNPPAEVAANEPITAPAPRPASPPPARIAKQEPATAPSAAPNSTEASETAPAPSTATAEEANKDTATAPTEDNTANAETADDGTTEDKSSGTGGLSFDKLVKKTADGSCKLDLPWVKIKFDCKKL